MGYTLLHLALFVDIMHAKPNSMNVTAGQFLKVGLRYLSHLRQAFEDYRQHRLSFFENPKLSNGGLWGRWKYVSRGYDNRYLEAGEECGGKDVEAQCDILYACNALKKNYHGHTDNRDHKSNNDWSKKLQSRRYFFYWTEQEAQTVMNCFYEKKREVDKEMSDNFEIAFEGLKTLIHDNINSLPEQEARDQMYLHKWVV